MEGILTSIGEFLNGLGPLIALPVVIALLGIILRTEMGQRDPQRLDDGCGLRRYLSDGRFAG
jgi:hypothetical protein